MLRAQTYLNLYFCIHANGNCIYKAEELSQLAGLPFQSENKRAITKFDFDTWTKVFLKPQEQLCRPSPAGSTRSSLSCTMFTHIHSAEPLEAPNAFSNHWYTAFAIQESHQPYHTYTIYLIGSCTAYLSGAAALHCLSNKGKWTSCPCPTWNQWGCGLGRRSLSTEAVAAPYPTRHLGPELLGMVQRAAALFPAHRAEGTQAACAQFTPPAESGAPYIWPSVSWSSPVKTKAGCETGNALGTRCFTGVKPFWVNTLQRAQII